MMNVQLKPTWKLDIENSTLDIKDLAEAKFSVILFEKFMYDYRFSGRNDRTAAPARHISEFLMTSSSFCSFSR